MYEYTLDEIKKQNNEKLLSTYKKEIESLRTNRISTKVVDEMYGNSIIDIIMKIEEQELKNTSLDLFPNDLVLIHSGIKERKASKFITCDFSGGVIYPGSLYINYRPLIENISSGNVYVLKRTIKTEITYFDYLPTNIQQFEQLRQNILLENSDNYINYEHINKEIGGDLVLQKLKRRIK